MDLEIYIDLNSIWFLLFIIFLYLSGIVRSILVIMDDRKLDLGSGSVYKYLELPIGLFV